MFGSPLFGIVAMTSETRIADEREQSDPSGTDQTAEVLGVQGADGQRAIHS